MSRKTLEIIEKAEKLSEPLFKIIDNDISLYNQKKVLNAFREHRVATRHFAGTSGYGYDDVGRDTLCNLFATIFGAGQPMLISITSNLSKSPDVIAILKASGSFPKS